MQETVGDVGVVVMLTQCWEGSREKCGQYFPATMDVPKLDLEANESGNQPPKSAGGYLFRTLIFQRPARLTLILQYCPPPIYRNKPARTNQEASGC